MNRGYKVLRSGSVWAALRPMSWYSIATWTICTGGLWLPYRALMYWLHRVPIGWQPVDYETPWLTEEKDALALIHSHKRQKRTEAFKVYDIKISKWEEV